MGVNPETGNREILDGLMFNLLDFDQIKQTEGIETAHNFWDGVRQRHIFDLPGMSEEVFVDFVTDASNQLRELRL